MVELAALAFVLSMDNVRLAAGLAILERSTGRYWRFAVVIALVEGTFPLLGAAVASGRAVAVLHVEIVGSLVLAVAIVLSIAGALTKRCLETRWMLYALPVLFGLDNLAAGAAFGLTGTQAVGHTLFVGAVSGAVSLVTMIAVDRCVAPLSAWWAGRLQHAR
jgi:putative Mn2+ efflux pump MntP